MRGDLYAVFHGTRWATTTRKRVAVRYARSHDALVGVIRGAALACRGYGMGWDASTFRAVMDVIRDYRESS